MKAQIYLATIVVCLIVSYGMSPTARAADPNTFTEKDFYWDKNTTPWKSIIMEGVNRLHEQNPKCANLEPSTADVSLHKGTKKDPVFYVYCRTGDLEGFNYFFSKSDVENNKQFVPYKYIDQEVAKDLCEKYVKGQATNSQSVKYSRLLSLAVTEFPNGRTQVLTSFKASNLLGIEKSLHVTCLLDERGFIEGKINEK